MFRILVALTLLGPAISEADPIITTLGTGPGATSLVTGWSNDQGNFAVDIASSSNPDLAGFSIASYSTETSQFSLSGSGISYLNASGGTGGVVPADVQIKAIVQGNGTTSGNLLSGSLTIRAGPNGFPSTGGGSGVGPGQLLLVGDAVEAAALPIGESVDFLFHITYAAEALSGLGDYATFWGPYSSSWGIPPGSFAPWGRDWGPLGGFDFFDLEKTVRVPQPSSLALLSVALTALAVARRCISK